MFCGVKFRQTILSLSCFSVLFISHDVFAARMRHRVGSLNLAKSGTVPLSSIKISSGSATNDPCPINVVGFGETECRMCINDLEKRDNADIKKGSFIEPITEARSGGNMYELCGRYLPWHNCFNSSLAKICALKPEPDCTEDAPGQCTACINNVLPAKWWNKPSWWFKNRIHATATDCDSVPPVANPPPTPPTPPALGTCSFSYIDVSGFSTEEQENLFNKLSTGVPGATGLNSASFFAKTDWTIADLKIIKSNLNDALNGSDGMKRSFEDARERLARSKLEVAKYEAQADGISSLKSSANAASSAATFAVVGASLSAVSSVATLGMSSAVYSQSNKMKKKTYLMNSLTNKGN